RPEQEVDVTGHQVLQRVATIGYQGELRCGFLLKEHGQEMITGYWNPGRRLVRIGPQPNDQFPQVFRWHRFPCIKNGCSRGQQRDRCEIIQHVVWKRIESAVQHMCGYDTKA